MFSAPEASGLRAYGEIKGQSSFDWFQQGGAAYLTLRGSASFTTIRTEHEAAAVNWEAGQDLLSADIFVLDGPVKFSITGGINRPSDINAGDTNGFFALTGANTNLSWNSTVNASGDLQPRDLSQNRDGRYHFRADGNGFFNGGFATLMETSDDFGVSAVLKLGTAPGVIGNADFEAADALAAWSVQGNGSEQIIAVGESHAIQLSTKSQILMQQRVDFDALSKQLNIKIADVVGEGTLTVSLDGEAIGEIVFGNLRPLNPPEYTFAVPPQFLGKSDVLLDLEFNTATLASVSIDSVAFSVPEPTSFGALSVGTLAAGLRRVGQRSRAQN